MLFNTVTFNDQALFTYYRCPFLLDVMLTVMVPINHSPTRATVAPLCTAYSLLMFQRLNRLCGFQKLLTILAVKGEADDMVSAHELSYIKSVDFMPENRLVI